MGVCADPLGAAWIAARKPGRAEYARVPGNVAPVDGLLGLDIGCGEGSNTRELARLGARRHAVDVAPTFIRHARDQEKADRLGVTYLIADARDLPFSAGSFDFATAFMSMMDMADQGQALCETACLATGWISSILHPAFRVLSPASPHLAGAGRHDARDQGGWLFQCHRRAVLDDKRRRLGARSLNRRRTQCEPVARSPPAPSVIG